MRLSTDTIDFTSKKKALISALFLQNSKRPEDSANSSNANFSALSFAEHRLWFFDQLHPQSCTYNIVAPVEIIGHLDLSVLEQSLQTIVQRHSILQTVYTSRNGRPARIHKPLLKLPFRTINLRTSSLEDSAQELKEFIHRESKTPFHLSEGPLFRVTVLQKTNTDYLLLLSMHHIISDGWSIFVFLRELATHYTSLTKRTLPPLRPLALQYSDHAAWQHEFTQSASFQEQLSYWKSHLTGNIPALDLPADSTGVTDPASAGHIEVSLSEGLTQSLQSISTRCHATMYMTLLATLQVLLHRLSGQEKIFVGSPVAGRNQMGTEDLIGLFLNTLVLKGDFTEEMTFEILLERTRKVVLDALTNQDVPFDRLVQELRPERHQQQNPLFNVLFNFLNNPSIELQIPNVKATLLPTLELDAKFWITLYAMPVKKQLQLKLVYERCRFSQERAQSMLDQFQHLLLQIAANPKESIQRYSLVSPDLSSRLPNPRIELNSTPYPTIDEMFKSQLKQNPDHPAVIQGKETWSYQDLSRVATFIAKWVSREKNSPAETIAVIGSLSPGLIGAMLGTFFGGAVLLPLNRMLPQTRLRQMVRETNTTRFIFVGDRQDEDHWLDTLDNVRILRIGETLDKFQHLPLRELHHEEPIYPDQPAYIFFTSGSTGTPKGILGNHKGLSHFLHWQRETFHIGPQDRAAQLTGLSFDVVLRDIFTPLISGSTLVLPEENESFQERMIEWLKEKRITFLNVVPSLAQSWLKFAPANLITPELRCTFFAGEPLSDTLIHQWRKVFIQTKIINLYGPTETTLAKCYHVVNSDVQPGIQPVGKPLPQTQALILNSQQQLCGVGEVGEIVLRTPFRTLGYLDRSKEEGRFVQNPFSQSQDDIVYKTGDLGRYRLDGSLDILGRIDQQVKIRGVRIDLDEIASIILAQSSEIRACVVTAQQRADHEHHLVGYLVAGESSDLISLLRANLSNQLPSSMIPSTFIFLDQLPLTANGKVDRKGLPPPSEVTHDLKSHRPPRNRAESQMVSIWERSLGKKSLGITDNFFELGGHSLLAVRVIAEMNKAFGENFHLNDLFQNPTIEALSKRLKRGNDLASSTLIVLNSGGASPPFCCVPGRSSTVLTLKDLAKQMGPSQPFFGFQSHDLPGHPILYNRIEEIASAYIGEIQKHQPTGPYHLGGFCFGSLVAFEMAHQLIKKGHEVGLLALIEPTITPFGSSKLRANFDRYGYHLTQLLQKNPTEQLQYIMNGVRNSKNRYVWTTDLEYKERLEIFITMVSQYALRPYPGKISMYLGKDTYFRWRPDRDPRLLWKQYAQQGFELYEFPGDHTNLLQDPFVLPLAKQLASGFVKN